MAARSLGLLVVLTGAPVAQPAESSLVAEFTRERLEGEADRLMRVGAWGGANLLGGFVAATMLESDLWSSYGLQSAAWGAVNLGIVSVALSQEASTSPTTLDAERTAERRYQRVLRVNMALNGGYAVVGSVTALSAPSGPDGARQRGHGAAIITQGAALLLLDGLAYRDSRRRRAALPVAILGPSHEGVRLSVRL